MTSRNRELPFLFVVAALDVLAIGYRYLPSHPFVTAVTCALALLGLAVWYARVRHRSRQDSLWTARILVWLMTALVVFVPFLLRKLAGVW